MGTKLEFDRRYMDDKTSDLNEVPPFSKSLGIDERNLEMRERTWSDSLKENNGDLAKSLRSSEITEKDHEVEEHRFSGLKGNDMDFSKRFQLQETIENGHGLRERKLSDSYNENNLDFTIPMQSQGDGEKTNERRRVDRFKKNKVDLIGRSTISEEIISNDDSLEGYNDYLSSKRNLNTSDDGQSYKNVMRELESIIDEESSETPVFKKMNERFDSEGNHDHRKSKLKNNKPTCLTGSRNSHMTPIDERVTYRNGFESEDSEVEEYYKRYSDHVNKERLPDRKSEHGIHKSCRITDTDEEKCERIAINDNDGKSQKKYSHIDHVQSNDELDGSANKQRYRTSTPKFKENELEFDNKKRKNLSNKNKHHIEYEDSDEEDSVMYNGMNGHLTPGQRSITEINGENSQINQSVNSKQPANSRKIKENTAQLNSSNINNEIDDCIDDIFSANDKSRKKFQRQGRVNTGGEAKRTASRNSRSRGSRSNVNAAKLNHRDTEEAGESLSLKASLEKSSSFNDYAAIPLDEISPNRISRQLSLSSSNVSNISSTPKEKSSSKSPSSKSPPSKSPLFKAFTFQDQDTTYSAPSSSSVLKEMVYRQWLEKKKQQTKEEIKSKMVARKKAREEAEMESKERKISAKKTFDAWNESKTETILTEKELKQKAKLAEKEKLEESLQRKRDAEKYFESWKREKTEKQKKLNSQKKKEEREKEKETFLEKRKTTTEALKAFESWKAQKDMSLSEIKQKKEEEKKRQEEEKLLELERKQEAKRVFEEWKSKKSPRRSPSPCRLTQRSWCPAGRNLSSTIPPKVQPVVIRQRHVVSR